MKNKYTILSVLSILTIANTFGQKHKSDTTDNKNLEIVFNARSSSIDHHPVYEIDQDGYITLEINDINLFRYSVDLTEIHNNVINSTRLSEGNTKVNIDPSLFKLANINLNVNVASIQKSNEAKELARINLKRIDLKKKKENAVHALKDAEYYYYKCKSRIDSIGKIDNKLENIKDGISLLGDDKLTKEQKVERKKLLKSQYELENKKNYLLKEYSFDIDSAYVKEFDKTLEDTLLMTIKLYTDSLDNVEYKYKAKVIDNETDEFKYENFNLALKRYMLALRELNELSDFYQRLVSLLYSDKSFIEIEKDKFKIANDVLHVNEAEKDDILKESYGRFRKIEENYQMLTEAYSDVEAITNGNNDKSKIKEKFNSISAFNKQIEYKYYQQFFEQLATVYDAINASNFTIKYRTLIISDNADEISYNLKATPHTNLPYSVETNPIDLKYNVKINGGVKIDVSTGIFWNIGLNDKSYRFEEVDANSSKIIEESNEDHFKPSLGVLFNVYKRSNKNIKFGGNVGFSTNSDKLSYYLGASMLIGRSERVNINVGFAGTQVQRGIDKYTPGETIPVAISDLPNEVPLRNPSPFKIGAYFGISFNLLGTKNKNTLNALSR